VSDSGEIARWRQKFELVDGVLTWRADPTRNAHWKTMWAGKPVKGARVVLDGRKLSAAMIARAIESGRIDVPPEARQGASKGFDYDREGLPDHVQVGQGPLSVALAEAAAEAGTSRTALTVLHKGGDPFLLDTPRGHAEGHWFAAHFRDLTRGRRVHLRGVHYLIAAAATILKPRGPTYMNTDDDWRWLVARAAKCARWLGYVPFDAIDDSRNEAPRYHRVVALGSPSASAMGGLDLGEDIDVDSSMPIVTLHDFTPSQKYAFAIFGEKSSLTPFLAPLAVHYGADLYIGAGELSDTLAHDIAKRAAEDGRTLVVFTVCDFDPSGRQMTTSIARNLRAFKTLLFPNLEYRVREIGLTLEQAIDNNLPSTPLKETERRAANWIGRFGREQTEIDALLALAPGVLESEVHRAFAPYWDRALARRAALVEIRWRRTAQQDLTEHVGPERIAEWRGRYESALAEIEEVNDEQDEVLSEFEAGPPELPEAEPGDEPDDGDVASSAWSLADESLALKARKAFDDKDEVDE
jgi:hypothetical protein